MANATLEHVNITVRDAERSAALLHQIFGWEVRWSGPAMAGGRTVHVGSRAQYVALYSPKHPEALPDRFDKSRPLNHVGVLVDDLEAAEQRVVTAGLEPFNHGAYEPGRRFYFFDPDGIEYEVVSYSPVTAAGATIEEAEA